MKRICRATGLLLPCMICLLSAPAWSAPSNRQDILLRNGARIEGDVLKDTPDALFLDLGYEALTIPRKAINTAVTAQSTSTVYITSASVSAASIAMARRGQPGVERRVFSSHAQMIDTVKRSVVAVSNPGGWGTGFVIDQQGHVMTNHHVVRNQQYHSVSFFLKGEDGVLRRTKIENVELVAFSRLLDIALLQLPLDKIKDLKIEPLTFGSPDDIKVGDPVFAIGNPGMGRQMLDVSVTNGIISSTSRNFNDVLYMQTDAPVNPGNSGGPLLNAAGEVIGLVTLKAIFQENIAFALPDNYISIFLNNEKAYAFDKSNPNRAYRYLAPAPYDPKEKAKNKEDKVKDDKGKDEKGKEEKAKDKDK
ncbi:MAG: serine protease [Candidatus Sumerlaeota bacterium]|nr:serine protease [Candidatus Sumerlaeota bacterium]